MKKYIIAEKVKLTEIYLMDFISIPMFGDSPQMTKNIKEAKVYNNFTEANNAKQEVGRRAYLLETS